MSSTRMISKKNNEDNIFRILIGILIITTIALVVVWLVEGRKNKEKNPIVDEVYNYFNIEDLTNCDGLFNYSSNLVNYDKVSLETKLCIAYHNANIKDVKNETLKVSKKSDTCKKDDMIFKANDESTECEIQIIARDLIDNSYNKLFGKKEDDIESFTIDSMHTCYLKDDNYYCGLSETFTYILGSSSVYRVIKDYQEKGSELVIYDYFIKLNDTTCYKNYTTDDVNQKCTDKYKKNKKLNYKFMKKYGILYKHIYEKNEDGSYHWVSSEPVK